MSHLQDFLLRFSLTENILPFTGDTFLRASVVVEKLGGWQNTCPDDGLGHWGCSRCREAAKEAATSRLPG